MFEMGKSEWTGWDLNPWPPACKAGDLPLIYRPLHDIVRVRTVEIR